MICLSCKKQTANPKFCCQSCSASFNNKGIQRNKPKKRYCIDCNKEFVKSSRSKSNTYCLECSNIRKNSIEKSKNKTLKEFYELPSVKDKHPSWRASHIREFNRRWNKDLTKIPCQVCGYSKHVDLCHIKDICDFPETALLKEVNNPNNIYVLCKNHHWEFDNDCLDLPINLR